MMLNKYFMLLCLVMLITSTAAQLTVKPTQVFVNRDQAISSSEVFGISKDLSTGGLYGGMYIETINNSNGRPFYGFAVDNAIKSYTYFDNADSGLHTYLEGIRHSVWRDSMEWKTQDGGLLRFHGYKLSVGKNGNAIVGYSSVFNDSPGNNGNSVFGSLAAQNLTGGVANTIMGSWSSWKMTTGDFNTLIGSYTGADLITGSKNTMIGYYAGSNSGTNSTGNVFLGYRAGDFEQGSNKLYIANTETAAPLIYGDFATSELEINGSTQLDGTLTVNGSTVHNGLTTINQQLTSQDINIKDNNPYLQFQQNSSPKYYLQYQSSGDQFVIVEVGEGTVLKFKDGEVYLPELAGGGFRDIRVDNNGRITTDLPSPLLYYGPEFYASGTGGNVWRYTRDLRNGMTISSMDMVVKCSITPVGVINFVRYPKAPSSLNAQAIFQFNPPGNGCGTFSTSTVITPGSNVIDTDNYHYYLYTADSDTFKFSEIRLHH